MRAACFLLLGLLVAGPANAGTVRKTQFHAAIAYHAQSGGVGWASDRATSREARIEALRQCSHPGCEIAAWTCTR